MTSTATHESDRQPAEPNDRSPSRILLLVAVAVVVVVVVVAAVALGRDDERSTARLDEGFDGRSLDSSLWRTCHWWDDDGCTISSNEELQWYRPDDVRVVDGRLQLTARERTMDASDGETYRYTSGMVSTGPGEQGGDALFEFTYGRAEARVRVPSGQGLWSAFWLLPSTTESRPEVDIMELLGDEPSNWMFHLHPADRDAESAGTTVAGPDASDGWHDIGIEWAPDSLRWFIDGEEVWSVEGGDVPDEPMYLVLNLAVGGEYPGAPDGSTQFPATLEVDRVTVSPLPE